jgi:hypothetical protein
VSRLKGLDSATARSARSVAKFEAFTAVPKGLTRLQIRACDQSMKQFLRLGCPDLAGLVCLVLAGLVPFFVSKKKKKKHFLRKFTVYFLLFGFEKGQLFYIAPETLEKGTFDYYTLKSHRKSDLLESMPRRYMVGDSSKQFEAFNPIYARRAILVWEGTCCSLDQCW